MTDKFNQRKMEVLKKLDKSSKGDWDNPILKLCNKINKQKNYYTTSSCSGRVLLMIDQEKKAKGLFNWVSHKKFTFNELKKEIEKLPKDTPIKYKQDPCILHIACRSIKDAQTLYDKAKSIGWKRSGLISFEKRIVLEINSTEKLEFPIIQKGRLLVEEDFLKAVTYDSNEKLKRGWNKIKKLEQLI
ncbi:hypothetical protein KAR91_22685 [Candidatus Pacearchaeota archaeon]|nr:hypothetical protein [Candidatus Pacearchaeota archaeon]